MKQAKPILGSELIGASFAVKGALTLQQGVHLLKTIVRVIGMRPCGAPAWWQYPTHSGDGGTGFTIIQPLVESFAIIDSWDEPELGGFYLVIHSCRHYDPYRVWSFLDRRGFIVVDTSSGKVQLLQRRNSWLSRVFGGY